MEVECFINLVVAFSFFLFFKFFYLKIIYIYIYIYLNCLPFVTVYQYSNFADWTGHNRWMVKTDSSSPNCCPVQGTAINSSFNFEGANQKARGIICFALAYSSSC
jgi:hypothetical protein